jgi:hypothetical protein
MFIATNTISIKNTTHKVVLPFYIYASLTFLVATIFLFFSSTAFTGHYFHPQILVITHAMALGWGTMIILGASHQLVPVVTESRLYSIALAHFSFVLCAIGIPLLLYSFYFFNMGWPAKVGGALIVLSVFCYLINLAGTITKSKTNNVHAVFAFTAALWLLLTTLLGLALVYNFTYPLFTKGSLAFLPLHAHMGIIGWFLLMVIGVGSRLIPMFLISKYSNTKLLWQIYILINSGLIIFLLLFIYFPGTSLYLIPVTAIIIALMLFGYYCYNCYRQRIRKHVDEQIKISLLSVLMMVLPLILLIIIIVSSLFNNLDTRLVLAYGFTIFFGWITAIIFGMTFKTLPFIIWNKVYHLQSADGKTPNPKDLFNNKIFTTMAVVYLAGFILFIAGIYSADTFLLKAGAVSLMFTAILYNWNVITMMLHKSVIA